MQQNKEPLWGGQLNWKSVESMVVPSCMADYGVNNAGSMNKIGKACTCGLPYPQGRQ